MCIENNKIKTKKCIDCENIKPTENFYKDKSYKSGYSSRCKVCYKKRYHLTKEEKEAKKQQKNSQDPNIKVCKSCRERKTLGCFYKQRIVCKTCVKKENQIKRLQNIEKNENLDYENKEKHCTKCGKVKKLINFYKSSIHSSGVSSHCKKCVDDTAKEKRDKIREKDISEFSIKVAFETCRICEQIKTADNFHRDKYTKTGITSICKDCKREVDHEFHKDYFNKNRDVRNAYTRNKRKTNDNFKLSTIVATAICESIKENNGSKKGKHVWNNIGYSLQELKQHIENQWENWMNWENHGRYDPNIRTWQLDHKIPQVMFPYTSLDDPNFKRAWALENLQPLEAIKNIRKGNLFLDEYKELLDKLINLFSEDTLLYCYE